MIYSINRNINTKKLEFELDKEELEKIKKIVKERVWLFNELIIRKMNEDEIERISYHIQASIRRSKNKNRQRKNIMFVSEFGYGYTKLMAERFGRRVRHKNN